MSLTIVRELLPKLAPLLNRAVIRAAKEIDLSFIRCAACAEKEEECFTESPSVIRGGALSVTSPEMVRPELCFGCSHNQAAIEKLQKKVEKLQGKVKKSCELTKA